MPLSAKVRIIQDLPTRYLTTKPFKTKIEVTKLQGPLPAELMKQMDDILSKTKVEEAVSEKWKAIKESGAGAEGPENKVAENSLYVFQFSRRFKHPSIRGKLIFALTFWNPFELIDNVGQMHGFFLDPPFQIVMPKTKDEWIKEMMKEQADKGRPVTKRDYEFYKKAYKRFVDQRKWIDVVWVPTWTLDGVHAIHSRVSGIQSETSLLVRTRKELSEIIPQYTTLRDVAESQKTVEEAFSKQIHILGDELRTARQTTAESRRRELEKGVPIIIPPGHKEFPEIPEFPPAVPPKPVTARIFEGIKPEDIINASPIVLGLFFIIGFAVNPFLTGLGILGVILFLGGLIFYFWRKRARVAIPEVIKEKAVEAKEKVEETVRGP